MNIKFNFDLLSEMMIVVLMTSLMITLILTGKDPKIVLMVFTLVFSLFTLICIIICLFDSFLFSQKSHKAKVYKESTHKKTVYYS